MRNPDISSGDRRYPIPTLLLISAALLCGCGTASVRTLSPQYQTVFIEYANNSTLEYGVEERLTDSMVQEFQREGTLRQVPTPDAADLVLHLNVIEYDLDPVTYDNDDRAAGRNLTVAVQASARDRRTGVFVMPEQAFSSSGTFFLSNTPGVRKEDDVYRRIAEDIMSRLIEGW
jgi:outer membrane lipopolysaccharide assembly protein LptE/RlpB